MEWGGGRGGDMQEGKESRVREEKFWREGGGG